MLLVLLLGTLPCLPANADAELLEGAGRQDDTQKDYPARSTHEAATWPVIDPRLNAAALRLARLIRHWKLPRVPWDQQHVVYVIFVCDTKKTGLGSYYVDHTSKIYSYFRDYSPADIAVIPIESYEALPPHPTLHNLQDRSTFLERKCVQLLESRKWGLNSGLPGSHKREMRDIVRLDWNYSSTPGVYQSVANQSLTCICPCLLNNAQVGGHRLTPSVPPPCRIRQAQNISGYGPTGSDAESGWRLNRSSLDCEWRRSEQSKQPGLGRLPTSTSQRA
eukprot:jgi/Botrbrau1/16663/Bobra.0068s0079.1